MNTRVLIATKSLLSVPDALVRQNGGLLKWLGNREDSKLGCLIRPCLRNYSLKTVRTCGFYYNSCRTSTSHLVTSRRYFAQTPNVQQNNSSFSSLLEPEDVASMSNSRRDDEGTSQEELRLRALYEPREIRFKTPYGHVACLEWGHREAPHKILCIHGWLDNAGSFERLIPFILGHKDNRVLYHVVAMDMPGVGHSSHRPVSTDYTTFSNVIEMRRVTTELGWTNNVTLLSHSLGAHLSFLYSCIYPRQVDSFISIDVARPITFQATNWNVTIANSIENHFRCEYNHEKDTSSSGVVPTYTQAEALKRLMEAHSASLTRESALVLMKRGARESDGHYTFNRDVRHRYLSAEFRPDDDLMMKYLDQSFSPNLLIIRSTKSPFRRPEEIRLKYYEIFAKNCPIFRDKIIDGTHHLHMNTPDRVAEVVNEFLDDVRLAKLRQEVEGNSDGSGGKSPFIGKPNL